MHQVRKAVHSTDSLLLDGKVTMLNSHGLRISHSEIEYETLKQYAVYKKLDSLCDQEVEDFRCLVCQASAV